MVGVHLYGGINVTFTSHQTEIARLWEITPRHKAPIRLTDHDKSVVFEGHRYRVDNSFEASAVQSTINGGQSNITILTGLSDDRISKLDIERGVYDSALVRLYAVDYKDPDNKNYLALVGRVGRIIRPNEMLASLDVIASNPRLYSKFNEKYTPYCRAEFGDERCTVSIEAYRADFEVTGVTNAIRFTSADLTGEPLNRFKLGHVRWRTGLNAGRISEVIANNAGVVTILIKPPYPIDEGDTGAIYQGCPKTLVACTEYGNKPNFRGEPYVPTEKGIRAQHEQ